MIDNPYKFTGPLDPMADREVLIPRTRALQEVADGVRDGLYWVVFGLRQSGKSTFVRQLRQEFPHYHHVYIDFELPPTTRTNFYLWVIGEFQKQVSHDKSFLIANNRKKYPDPEVLFMHFLEEFQPKKQKEGILLLFEEIETIEFIGEFLKTWRKVFQDRFTKPDLKRYALIITASAQLSESINLPENFAQHTMTDFSENESLELLDQPFLKRGAQIFPAAKKLLISRINGHPQVLQEACSLLLNKALAEKKTLGISDVEQTFQLLFEKNTTFFQLKQDMETCSRLKKLVAGILKGKQMAYLPFKVFSNTGAGCVVKSRENTCMIRNTLYHQYLQELNRSLDSTPFLTGTPSAGSGYEWIIQDYGSRFQIMETIGSGGMGTVKKAMDTTLNRLVALKMLKEDNPLDNENIGNLKHEAQLLANLKHPNIVTVHDFGKIKDEYVIIMEYLEGTPLDTLIHKNPQLSFSTILHISKKIMKGLQAAHAKGIYHLDIKPKNIILEKSRELKIVDFGLSVLRDHVNAEVRENLMGTPFYLSPEQISLEAIDQRSDVYSCGITLFQLTAGEIPFKGADTLQIIDKHLNGDIPSLTEFRKDIPSEWSEIVMKCMQKDPKNRFQSASEVLAEMERLNSPLEPEWACELELQEWLDTATEKLELTLNISRTNDKEQS